MTESHYKSSGDLDVGGECGEIEETQEDLTSSPAEEF